MIRQRTLKREYRFEGKGLHSGLHVVMTVAPAPADHGIVFFRKDIAEDAYIEALADYVTYTQRGTTLEKGDIKISTIEHILSALTGLGVDNALITLDSFEAPILDGSALPFVQAFMPDGTVEQDAPKNYYEVKEPIHYKDEQTGSELTLLPADDYIIDLSIDYNSSVLGIQKAYFDKNTDFATEIAPCRTFVFFHELEFLFNNNLIKGGDLENAIVIVEKPVADEELERMASLFNVKTVTRLPSGYLDHIKLHFPNECARHKLLDIIGDFTLIGRPLKCKVIAEKSGHKINTCVAKIVREKIKSEK